MKQENFIELVTSKLVEITGCDVKVNQVIKNNGLTLNGLVILREGRNVQPTIYLESFYEDYEYGEPIEDIIDRILELEKAHQIDFDFDVTEFQDFNKVKVNLYYKLVNYNFNSERLKDIPHKKVLDLAKVYYIEVENEVFGNGTILVTNNYVAQWNVTLDEIDIVATRNTETNLQPSVTDINEILKNQLKSMFDGLKESEEIPEDSEIPDFDRIREYPMYVVTNHKSYYGASVLVYKGLLKTISDIVKDNLIIFPSSVHEFIFINEKDAAFNPDMDLKDMVKTINGEVVAREEVLSDNVYYYNRLNAKLTIY